MGLPVVMSIEGDVTAAHSHWTQDGSRIVTEATIHTPDGDVTVSQLGGSADGLGMRMLPGPDPLEVGMHVAVAAHHALDAAQNDHIALDDVRVLAFPPGYVRTGPTKAGHYLYWESGCIFVTIDSAGTTAIPGDAAFQAIDQAFATWNDDTATCSYMKVMSQGKKAVEVGNDKVNVVKFRDTVWGRPAIGNDPARVYPRAAAGITTVVYVDDANSARDGAIVDADIEINGVDFDVTIDPDPADPQNAVLLNTLTHEVGHLHGLEHTCHLSATEPATVDNKGNPVPLCGPDNPASVMAATMYPSQTPGETMKETLTDDDIQSMCDLYPTAKDPKTCEPVAGAPGGPTGGGGGGGGGGCNTTPGTDVGLLISGTALGLLLTGRRRSGRATRRQGKLRA
ncbi:MAG TPA: hypothetical protein VFP84_38355 [Kofleriaceae bacterium]|nr:hypothetical protein [Kofleriaceae bacterium]